MKTIGSTTGIWRIGYLSALTSFVAAAGFSIAQILQVIGVLPYPFDAIFIYGFSLGIAIPFMLAMLALQYVMPEEHRFRSHGAVLFAVIYVVYVTLNYVVQLAVVMPFPHHEPVLEQTPHSLFWTVDALGYLFMGFATLWAFPLFANNGFEKRVRLFFLANGLINPVIAFVYFYPVFSTGLLLIGIPWIITAPGSIFFLTIYFKKGEQNARQQ